MKTRDKCLLALAFPAMLALASLEILLSGRDLTQHFAELTADVEAIVETTRHPLVAWTQRGVSLLLLALSFERVYSHLSQRRPLPSPLLMVAFVAFWLTNVAAPAVLGAVPQMSHQYVYALVLGVALLLSGPLERDRILAGFRTAFLWFLIVSIALVPIVPNLVMDTSYSQGLLPGVPRFGGLAIHPVGMGVLTQFALLVLWARPFERRWVNSLAWTLGLAVLFFAQSKTAWVAFLLGATCMVMVRRLPDSMERMGDPRNNSFGVLLCLGVIVAVVGLLAAVLVADVPYLVAGFFDSSQGAQLMSMTGRDRIWIVAMEEWSHNPVFGYGPTIWDEAYRAAIGMPFATHAHNQFMDTLARSGTVGAVGLVFYAVVLLVQSFRYARASGGLSLALFAGLALLSIAEVPLMLFSYGTEVFTHLLLVTTLAGAAASRRPKATVVTPIAPTFRTAE